MKNLQYIVVLIQGFLFLSFAQTNIPPGDVSGTWGIGGSPYNIQGDLNIPNDSTLTIEPGVLVEFQGYFALNVQGRLLALGTQTSKITFTINDTTGFHNPNITLGGWNGIQFIDTPSDNDSSKIIYCTLQFGKAVGSSPPDNAGGAFFISNFNKVLISNSLITNNSAGGSDSPSGGGIGLHFANITLVENDISYNRAWDGGGIKIWESDPVFIGNLIDFNQADEGGGGVWIGGLSNSEFSYDIITNNIAGGNGGGIICWGTTNTNLNSVNVFDNSANWGGGIGVIDCEIQINNCYIIDNGSNTLGGGLGADFSTVQINNTTFERDTAFIFGGAMGIYTSDLTITNSTFTENSSRVLGGGIHSDFSNININNTTFERDTTGESGGAIFTWHCDLNIEDCEFNENTAIYNGGAIFSDSSIITITNSDFTQNLAIWGGAILSGNSELDLNDCLFSENSSDHGGALSIGWSNVELNHISFDQNSAIWGGGISSTNCNLQIDSCFFYQNLAEYQGGGLEYLADTSGFISISQLEITNSKFEENISLTRCGAALIEQYNSIQPLAQLSIDNCEFINNNALRVGALRIGNISDFTLSNSKFIGNNVTLYTASCTFASVSSGDVFNCLFTGNVANGGTSGGAGISNSSKVDFMNCTFANNTSGSGGGIHVRTGSTVTLTNSILWGNYPDQVSLLATNDTLACTLYSNYNDIQFGVDSVHINDSISVVNWGIGNIDSVPLFVDTLNNNFHLQDLSPCIATGIDSIEIAGFWQYAPPVDIEGNTRPNPAGTMPDMGAYESQFPSRVEGQYSELPTEFSLSQNYPNPFNPITTIRWQMPEAGLVTLKIYDVLGREVTTLANEELRAGKHEINFDASRFSSGIYFYQLKAGNFIQTKKMTLLK